MCRIPMRWRRNLRRAGWSSFGRSKTTTTICGGSKCGTRTGTYCTSGVQTSSPRDILGIAMKQMRWVPFYASFLFAAAVILQAAKTDGWTILTWTNAFSDSAKLTPGTSRRITPKDLPAPSGGTPGKQKQVGRPAGAMPSAPAGFTVNVFAETGGNAPRQIRTAPNGDLFVMN